MMPPSPGCSPAVIKLGGAGFAMPGGLLHVLKLGAVFERRGDEGGANRVRRIAAKASKLGGGESDFTAEFDDLGKCSTLPFALPIGRRLRLGAKDPIKNPHPRQN
jgi:hypothetical protein